MIISNHKKSIKKDRLEEIIYNHLKIETKLLDLLHSEETNYDNLKNIIYDLLSIRNTTHKILRVDIDNYTELNLNIVKEKEMKIEIIDDFNNLESEISSVIDSLNKQELPSIDLNIIVSFLNNFNQYVLENKQKHNEINTSIDTILLESNRINIPLILKKKKIILTSRNFDLSQLSQDELIEILRILDVVIKDDTYDYLRTKIVEYIINISSISII